MTRRGVGRRLGAVSITAVLMASALLLGGGIAWAVTNAQLVKSYHTDQWHPPSDEPSGAAYIDGGGYLFVVDTNANNNNPSTNGWKVDINTGQATNRATGVAEPSGIDYDPGTNTLFITRDNGSLYVIENFDTPQEQRTTINVGAYAFDTEDPTYNRSNGRLYFLDGEDSVLVELNPGADGWGGQNIFTERSVAHLSPGSRPDWEGMTWDPRTGNLLLGYSEINKAVVYEVAFGNPVVVVNTVNVSGIAGLTRINGMGIAPASYDSSKKSLWVTDRNSSQLFEVSFDGTVPPSTSSTSTIQSTSTSTTTTSPTTTTTQPTTTTTTTTQPTTTTQATTTTTRPSTTTTTQPTTTTTQPPPPPPPPPPVAFTDVSGHLFAGAINWMSEQGLTKGCNPPVGTKFCPDDFVSRGQMAAFLVRAKGYPPTAKDFFTDDNDSVFEGAIDSLRAAGVTQGCNPPANTKFCPDDLVTRGQMAAFLVRAFGYTDGAPGDFFLDDDGSVFESAIDRLRVAQVTLGCNPPANDRYCPDDHVTRGEMAAFLKRAFGS